MTDLRAAIRSFVRMCREDNRSESCTLLSGKETMVDSLSSSEMKAASKLAIYNQILDETSYALPVVPKLSEKIKKERLHHAYQACMLSNEAFKQSQMDTELYTNITSKRLDGQWIYHNRETGVVVGYEEFMKRYYNYIAESKVFYDVTSDGFDDDMYDILAASIDNDEEEDSLNISSSSSSCESGISGTDIVISSSCSSEDSNIEDDLLLDDSNAKRGAYRKRCSSTASATDECNRLLRLNDHMVDGEIPDEYDLGIDLRKRSKSVGDHHLNQATGGQHSIFVMREKWQPTLSRKMI
jgi:hypothetical protein